MPDLRDPSRQFEQDETLPWPPPAVPRLAGDALDLWWIGPRVLATAARRDRNQAVLAGVLAAYLPPGAVATIHRDDGGRPRLAAPDAPDFNLSDSRGELVLAVAARGRIGIDLERCDRVAPAAEIARRWFHPDEAAALAGLAAVAAQAAFLRLWTCKEAACKAVGSGIAGQLAHWCFDPQADDPPRLRTLPAAAGRADDWWFQRLAPSAGTTCVIAARGFRPRLRRFLRVPG